MADTRTPAQTVIDPETPMPEEFDGLEETAQSPEDESAPSVETEAAPQTDEPVMVTPAEVTALTPEDRAVAPELGTWQAQENLGDPQQSRRPAGEYSDPEITPWRPVDVSQDSGTEEDPSQEAADALLSGKAPDSASATTEEPDAKAEDSAPSLDLPTDQEAADLAAQRDAEEQKARALLEGKSPDSTTENEPAKKAATPEEENEAKIQATPPGKESEKNPSNQQARPGAEAGKTESSPQVENHVHSKNVTIRSPGVLTTLAQGFNHRRELRMESLEQKQKAQRLDAVRAKFSQFTEATHELERQSGSLLQHPVMDAVRQAAPKGLDQADEKQKALIGSIVNSNPDFTSRLESVQKQHAEVVRRFEALEPDLDDIPGKERSAYTDIANRHIKKAEDNLQQIPDQKGGSLFERLKESIRAIGQRLGIVSPDVSVPKERENTAPVQASTPAVAQVLRPGRH